MKPSEAVFTCKIVKRLNRFVVEVEVEGSVKRAYITNTGRLEELIQTGRKGFCIEGGRKTDCRLFAIEDRGKGALIDTAMQMKAFEELYKTLPWMKGYELVRRNVRVGNSLLDYLFRKGKTLLYLELKSAVLRSEDNFAMYPDCPTERGRRHIAELIDLARKGRKAGIVFIAALPEAVGFRPYGRGDPEVSVLLKEALKTGVMIKAVGMYYDPEKGAVKVYSPDLKVEI